MSDPTSASEAPSLLSDALRSLTHAVARRPKTTLLLVALSVIACSAYTVSKLQFKTDRSDLIDPETPFHQRWIRYTQKFGESSDMVVVVEAEAPETIKHALDVLGGKLLRYPDLFSNVLYKVEPGSLPRKGLQYLPPESLAAGLDRLDEYRPILNGRWDLVRLDSVISLLRYQLQDLSSANVTSDRRLWDHAERLSESLARFAEDRDDFINPWPEIIPVDPALMEQANQTVYLLNEAGTLGFLMAAPAGKSDGFNGDTAAIDRLRTLIAETRGAVDGVTISLTGIPVLENDEMRRSQLDSANAGWVSFVGVWILFWLGFRGFRHPALGMVTLAIGMAWSFGFTTLVIGHLNILSVAFASIVIGLGNDFAIHLLSRYLDLRHHGWDVRRALVEASGTIGPGIVTGAVTTALAFFCAAFTSFLGVAELGVIAGGGILLCAVATFTALPAMVAVMDRRVEERMLPMPFQGKWLGNVTSRFSTPVLLAATAGIAMLGWSACDWSNGWPQPKVRYDHNLLNLQAQGLESVEAQQRIFDASNNSLLYAISVADSAEEARALRRKFEALPTVRHVEELASRMPQFPASESQLLVQGFHAYLSRLPQQPPPPTPAMPAMVGKSLDQFQLFLAHQNTPQAKRIAALLDRFLAVLDRMTLQEQMMVLGEFQYRLVYSLLAQFQALAAASDPEPVSPADLPPELASRYVSPQGEWLLQVFPKDHVWDMEPLKAFVDDVRSVDPEVTGTPLQNYEAALQIKQSYEVCAIYSLVVILLVLLIDFLQKEAIAPTLFWPGAAIAAMAAVAIWAGQPVPLTASLMAYTGLVFVYAAVRDRWSVIHCAVAIIPPILGTLMTFGLLAVLGIPLNPANLIILPLIIGIGVDNGVHVLHDYHEQRSGRYSPSSSLVNAIMMTSSTSIVGFGSMMLAAHRGLHSLGAVLTIGVGSCLFFALVVLPAALALLPRREPPIEESADIIGPAVPGDDPPNILPMPSIHRVA
jgi:hopanoid biosynthesis associated RND transporter like protein HpnN